MSRPSKPASGKANVPPRGSTARNRTRPQPVRHRPTRTEAEHRRRNQRLLAIGATAVVVVVILVLVLVRVVGGGSKNSEVTAPVTPAQLSAVTGIPVSTLVSAAESAPAGSVVAPTNLPASVPPLTSGGKPEIFYGGAEFCPFCAAQRWPLVMALSKFGTFSNLHSTKSSSTDVNANTPTFTFVGSSYTSPYLVFTPVELENRAGHTLQNPTPEQTQLIETYDTPPYISGQPGSIPFIFYGGRFVGSTQYDASAIVGKTFDSAVSYMTSGTSSTSRAAQAAAGHLVGIMCSLTNNQPSSVCSAVPAALKTGQSTSANQGSSSGG